MPFIYHTQVWKTVPLDIAKATSSDGQTPKQAPQRVILCGAKPPKGHKIWKIMLDILSKGAIPGDNRRRTVHCEMDATKYKSPLPKTWKMSHHDFLVKQ